MRYLLWILKFTLFVLVLALAIKNTGLVTVRYYFGGEWQSPLAFVLLVAFCAGVAVGLAAALSTLFRQRREIALLKGKLRRADQAGASSTENAGALIRG
jgi:lipopolysaccharide assembly protein A